jgi:hypothetical protein
VHLSESVLVPQSSHHEVAYYDTTLYALNDGLPTTLSDLDGPLTDGDLTWAFQWDFSLAPGKTFLISKDKLITPEPATLGVLIAVGGVLLRRRRRGR